MPAGGFSPDFSSDTPRDEFDYCGWVPCISGHLDFSLMRVGLAGEQSSLFGNRYWQWIVSKLPNQDSITDSFNYSYKDHPRRHYRRIALQSWYNWRDQKTSKDGKFRVVVIAETNQSNDPDKRVMQGFVCIYPRAYAKSENTDLREANESILNIFGDMRQVISTYGDIDPGNPNMSVSENTQAELNQNWLKLYQLLSDEESLGNVQELNEIYRIKFRIESNGLTYLKYQQGMHDNNRPSDHSFIVTRQAYYYLKYSLHKHRHHNHDADTLTTIVPINQDNRNFVGQILLLQLKRGLIYNKRIDVTTLTQHNTNTEALGFIAYARSLLGACLQQKIIDTERASKEMENIDALERSYHANNASYSQKQQHIDSTKQTARQWATIVLAYTSLTCLIFINLFPESRGARTLPAIDWLTSLSNQELLLFFAGGGMLLYSFVRTNIWMSHPYKSRLAYYSRYFTKRWGLITTFVIVALWAFLIAHIR